MTLEGNHTKMYLIVAQIGSHRDETCERGVIPAALDASGAGSAGPAYR